MSLDAKNRTTGIGNNYICMEYIYMLPPLNGTEADTDADADAELTQLKWLLLHPMGAVHSTAHSYKYHINK